jgi:hypothetical protein
VGLRPRECEREIRDMLEAEREERHRQIDDDYGIW